MIQLDQNQTDELNRAFAFVYAANSLMDASGKAISREASEDACSLAIHFMRKARELTTHTAKSIEVSQGGTAKEPECCGCVDDGLIAHSLDCRFGHFLAYTGLANEPDEVKAKLKLAYAHGAV